MEKSSKRGKIPQSDWPLIMARYDAGETLASIARTYDCSPPAISYVVSRSRARQPGAETPPPAPSTTVAQLIKAPASEPAVSSTAPLQAASIPPTTGEPSDRPDEIWPKAANGFARDGASERTTNPPGLALRTALPLQRPPASHAPAGPPDGDQRRTLHLSLGNPSQGNGGTPPAEHQPAERHNFANEGQHAQHQAPQHQAPSTKSLANALSRLRIPNRKTARPHQIAPATVEREQASPRHGPPLTTVRFSKPAPISPLARRAPGLISTKSCARGWTATSPPSSRHLTRRW